MKPVHVILQWNKLSNWCTCCNNIGKVESDNNSSWQCGNSVFISVAYWLWDICLCLISVFPLCGTDIIYFVLSPCWTSSFWWKNKYICNLKCFNRLPSSCINQIQNIIFLSSWDQRCIWFFRYAVCYSLPCLFSPWD